MHKKYLLLSFLIMAGVLFQSLQAQKNHSFKQDKKLLKVIEKNFIDAGEQYKILAKNLPEGKFPKTFFPQTGKYEFSNSDWWCSGFYPGTLLLLYGQTRDQALYTEAKRILPVLEKEKLNTGTHDLGFMMFCSFGNANRIEPHATYDEILLTSAKSLSTRFNPQTGCIKSWDSKNESDFLVIVDNMMNLDLLFWATKKSGDSSFYKIAVTHANTTMRQHYREDYSSYHVVNYNPLSGEVQKKFTAQGAADESAWARGQVWGLYGYTVMYRETRDERYLTQAKNIAGFLLDHPNLPTDKIPYWDFNAPGIPNALRDASAAAILASALIELSYYVDKKESNLYLKTAETIIRNLSGPDYKAAAGTNGGFLIKHGVGHLPKKSEVDVPLTYGDYYFVEAMIRYKRLGNINMTSHLGYFQ